jgi:hypothetical protein
MPVMCAVRVEMALLEMVLFSAIGLLSSSSEGESEKWGLGFKF